MPTAISAYRVFIASPGGLQVERDAFRTTIQQYNDADALERGVQFIPVGWEATLGGVGRPQSIINKQIRECDYFILVLWDRWGSSPHANSAGPFSSGTEEEYDLALKCLADSALPMTQVVVFFKAVDVRQLSDPGAELSRVLEFKAKLEREKTLLFHTFDSGKAFEEHLRRFLATWVRDHESGERNQRVRVPSQSTAGRSIARFMRLDEVTSNMQSPLVVEAERLANLGQYTKAEMMFARAVVRGDDPDAMNRFGDFLRIVGRLQQAEIVINMAVEWARQNEDDIWLGLSLNNLTAVKHAQARFGEAEALAGRALAVLQRSCGDKDPRVADSLERLASIHLARGRYADAEPLFRQAFLIKKTAFGENDVRLAVSLNNLGSLFRQRKDYISAEPFYREALTLLTKTAGASQNELTRTLHGLGIIYYEQKRYTEAEPVLRQARDITDATLEQDHPLVARSNHDLGMLYLAAGRLGDAEPLLRGALSAAEQALGPEHPSLAYSLNGLGELLIKRRKYEDAIPILRRAIAIRERRLGLEHPLLVPPLRNLAVALRRTKATAEARRLSDLASRIEKARDVMASGGAGAA